MRVWGGGGDCGAAMYAKTLQGPFNGALMLFNCGYLQGIIEASWGVEACLEV